MKKYLPLFLLLVTSPAGSTEIIAGTATTSKLSSGVNGENLADTPVTDTIPLGAHGGAVELNVAVTAGTSASFTVSFETSSDGTNWTWYPSTTNSGTAAKAVATYSLASVTKHTITLVTASRYVRVTFDDAADGSGTIIVRGNTYPF